MDRRQFLGLGVIAMTGDGLIRPVGAPPGGNLPIGVQPGVNSAIVIANKVIVFGPGGGVFVYKSGTTPGPGNPPIAWMSSGTADPYGNTLPSTTGIAATGTFQAGDTIINPSGIFGYSAAPALGNLITSSANSAGTDPFGNAYLPGLVNYTPGTTYFAEQSWQASILFSNATSGAGPWTQVGSIVCTGGASGMQFSSSSGGFTFGVGPVTAVAGTVSTPTLITTDTWHNITLDAGWTAGPQVPQYRLLPDGNVQTRGQATHASVTATTAVNSGTPVPAAYRPAQTRFYRAADPTDTAGLVQVDTTGVFSVRANATFPATQVLMDATYSLA